MICPRCHSKLIALPDPYILSPATNANTSTSASGESKTYSAHALLLNAEECSNPECRYVFLSECIDRHDSHLVHGNHEIFAD